MPPARMRCCLLYGMKSISVNQMHTPDLSLFIGCFRWLLGRSCFRQKWSIWSGWISLNKCNLVAERDSIALGVLFRRFFFLGKIDLNWIGSWTRLPSKINLIILDSLIDYAVGKTQFKLKKVNKSGWFGDDHQYYLFSSPCLHWTTTATTSHKSYRVVLQ